MIDAFGVAMLDLRLRRRPFSLCPKDPDIQQLAYTFKIDAGLTQKLNDIMIEKRRTSEHVIFSLTSQSTAHVRAACWQ